eukprot:scaffold85389_cov19-Tisochrysis_lutea.AAC.1
MHRRSHKCLTHKRANTHILTQPSPKKGSCFKQKFASSSSPVRALAGYELSTNARHLHMPGLSAARHHVAHEFVIQVQTRSHYQSNTAILAASVARASGRNTPCSRNGSECRRNTPCSICGEDMQMQHPLQLEKQRNLRTTSHRKHPWQGNTNTALLAAPA